MRWRQHENGRVVHRLEGVMLVLALLSIPVILLEETSDASWANTLGLIGDWIIWIGFTLELAFVAAVAPRKRAAVRAHWLDLLIVALTFPLAPTLLAAFRLARLFRIVRLLRLFALGARAITTEKMLTSRQGFRFLSIITGLLVIVSGITVTVADRESFGSVWLGLWWALTTVTTVGYGDIVPHTVAGRLLGAVLMILGIGFLSLLTATIASVFVKNDTADEPAATGTRQDEILAALRRIEERLDRLETTAG